MWVEVCCGASVSEPGSHGLGRKGSKFHGVAGGDEPGPRPHDEDFTSAGPPTCGSATFYNKNEPKENDTTLP